MQMHRNILTEGERQASMQDCKQSVSQAGSHACSQACMHTYRERDRCPQTDMQTETCLEIQTETEVHRVRDRQT